MKKSTKYVITKMKPYMYLFIMLLLGTIFSTIISETYPYIFGKIVDEVFYDKQIKQLVSYVLIYLFVFIFNQAIYFVVNISWAKLNTTFVFDVRNDMFNKVLRYNGNKLSKLNTGDVINRMAEDSMQMFNYVYWNIFYTITDVLCLGFALIFVGLINWKMMLIIAIMTPVIVYCSRYFAKIVQKEQGEIREQKGKLNAWIYEMLRGLQEVRFLGASYNLLNEYIRKSIGVERKSIRKDIVEFKSERASSFLKTVGTVIVYGVAALCICNGEATIGDFIAFVAYYDLCVKSFDDLNFVILGFGSNAVGIKRVMDIIDSDSEENKENALRKMSSFDISFANVGFCYEEGKQIFSDFNLNIKAGERIAIVGHSGSGKSTISSLLIRLYEIDKGHIYIGGHDIDEYDLRLLRDKIGIVHQESVFFDGTIRYNISFSNNKENDSRIWAMLKKANIYEYVNSLPNGLDTLISQTNSAFSGGQKQRLAIARVLYKQPSIIIFDEATSFLDVESEEEIKRTWDELEEDVTLIVIAHKASTIEKINRIVVLENGIIVGDNNHKQLIYNCDEYRLLFMS